MWSGGPAAAAPSCTAWNTEGFFQVARAADVSRCLKTQKVNARDEDRWTPLNLAARNRKNPAVVKMLRDAGADPAAKSRSDKTPWEHAKKNATLKGTEIYWRLHEGRFK